MISSKSRILHSIAAYSVVSWLVRALYSINGQYPYMLARSASKVAVSIIPSHLAPGSGSEVVYGKVSLRPCLDAICQAR